MSWLGDFLGSFTGSTGSKAAERAAGAYQDQLTRGFDQAFPFLANSYTNAQDAYTNAYNTARGDVASGLNTAHIALNNAGTNARRDLTAGYGNARDASLAGLAQINQYLSPYINAGNSAQGLYGTALGYNGADAARSFYQNYAANDPFRAFRDEQANKAILAQANAAGTGGVGGMANLANGAGGGRTAAAISRASLERGSQDMNTYLDRLARQSELGGQYAGLMGNFTNQAYGRNADLYAREGQSLGQLEQMHGAKLAELYTSNPLNNGSLSMAYGANMGNTALQQGRGLADLTYGYNQQLAGNQANMYNAKGQATMQGANNTVKLATDVAKMMMGLPPGSFGGSGGNSPTGYDPGSSRNAVASFLRSEKDTSPWQPAGNNMNSMGSQAAFLRSEKDTSPWGGNWNNSPWKSLI